MQRLRLSSRPREAFSLMIIVLIAFLGFVMAETAFRLQLGEAPLPALPPALLPPAMLALFLGGVHFLLRWRRYQGEEVILPVVGLLLTLGFIVIWRVMTPDFVWQQLTRGLLLGGVLMAILITRPVLVERIRRDWPVLISFIGLLLLLMTAFLGVRDEAGAQLALKIGPLPAIQTSELIKMALIIFLAWFIDWAGEAIEGESRPFLGFKLPPWRYFIPSGLFVILAILSLLIMKDLGAILILGFLFATILYAGLEARVFWPVALFGLALFLIAVFLIITIDAVPATVAQRFTIFLDPWSSEQVFFLGQQTTISEGPGSQVQHAIYAVVAGGLTGTGLGLGSVGFIPVAHSDFILAAIAEELGLMIILALLALFAILLSRILRVAIMLPPNQVFERLLLVGIAVHLFSQIFVIGGGTFKLMPLTGVTAPFLSYGGMALMVNLLEIGLVLALAQRIEA